MAWRMRYLTTRDHPLAFAAYAATFLLGLTLVTGWVDTVSLHGFDQFVATLWELQLLTGGLGALWSISQQPRIAPHWPDLGDLLRIEGIAAGQAAMGFFVYTYSIIHQMHSVPLGAVVLGVMGLGMMGRCVQAYIESQHAERLAMLYDEVQATLSSLTEFANSGAPSIARIDTEQIEVVSKAPDENREQQE